MDKDKVLNEVITPQLQQDEQLIGFFQAQYTPSLWWILLIGPLLFLGVRLYFVAITNKGLYFYRIGILGETNTLDYFTWDEITSLTLGSGFLTIPFKLRFFNERKLKLKVPIKGVQKIAKLDAKTKTYLIEKQK